MEGHWKWWQVPAQPVLVEVRVQSVVVGRHGGDIDKFVGDELMARFCGPDHESRAALCAVEMVEAVDELNVRREAQDGDGLVHVGVGVNSADVVLGAMGSTHRMDFTVIGDGVNLAARICSAAKPGETLVSEAVRTALGDVHELTIETLEPMTVKGKREPISVFRLSRKA